MMDKKPYHHGNLEETLIEAGLELLDKEGMSGFSLRKAASACGVSHAAPYKHFPDKEALLTAMGSHVAEKLSEATEAAWLAHKDKEDRMIFLGRSYLKFFLDNPHYFRFLTIYVKDAVNLSCLDKESEYRPFEIFRQAAAYEMERNNIPKERRDYMLISMWAAVHGLTSIATMQGVRFDGSWEELLSLILNMNRGGKYDD